jgi:hypothetical protein
MEPGLDEQRLASKLGDLVNSSSRHVPGSVLKKFNAGSP